MDHTDRVSEAFFHQEVLPAQAYSRYMLNVLQLLPLRGKCRGHIKDAGQKSGLRCHSINIGGISAILDDVDLSTDLAFAISHENAPFHSVSFRLLPLICLRKSFPLPQGWP